MLRGLPIIAYALLLGCFVASLASFPSLDATLPLRGDRPSVDLHALQGFTIEGLQGLPTWSAQRVLPIKPGSTVSLGGVFDALELIGVSVEMDHPDAGGGLRLVADRGRLADGRLTLSGGVRVDSRVVSGLATVMQGRIEFPGLVVFHHGTADEVTERGLSLDYADFVARVRRR